VTRDMGFDDPQGAAPVVDEFGHTRRELLKRTGLAGAAIALPSLLAACGSTGSGNSTTSLTGAGGKASGTEISHVTWGQVGQVPENLDVAKAWNPSGQSAASQGLEPLLGGDAQMQVRPVLARGWSQPDLTHYVFDLRQGVHFWDGTPLTVDDVVFSLERHLDPKVASQIGFYFENIGSIKAVSNSRILITLKEPDPTIPSALTLAPISSKKFVERIGDKLGDPGPSVTVMGTGPYEITSFTTSGGVELKRNEKYWGKRPPVQSATFKYFEEPQTMLLAARSGSIDGGFGFPLSEASAWAGLSGVNSQFVQDTGLTSAFISFNMEADPWSDIHVRRAVAHCCDTAGYTKAFLDGQALPANAVVAKAQWSTVASTTETDAIYNAIPQYAFDLEAAKQELEKSAYPDGFSATIPYSNTWPSVGRSLVSLSQQLKQIGIKLTPKPLTYNAWLALLEGHNDLTILGQVFYPDFNDPSDYMEVIYPSVNAKEGAFNAANFKNPTVDRLLQEQKEAKSKKERAKLLGKVLEISGDELPYLPLWWEGPTLAIQEKYVYNGLNALYYIQPWLDSIATRA
jgi:peptide/nickel transport system substrate-binding protein